MHTKTDDSAGLTVRPADPRAIVDLATAAERLGCCPDTVRNLIARGDLTAYRLGERGHLRFYLTDLDAVLRPVGSGRVA